MVCRPTKPQGVRAPVLVVVEGKGGGPFEGQRAEQQGKGGYLAFAADIYEKGPAPKKKKKPETPAGIGERQKSHEAPGRGGEGS